MGDAATKTNYYTVKACDATKITLHPFETDKPAAAVPEAGEITASLALTSGAVEVTYDQTQVKKAGTSGCVVFPAGASTSI